MTGRETPPDISVVIPTFDRAPRLWTCLAALEAQRAAPGSFEILVIDDGSTDGTIELLETAARESPVATRWFRQAHGGPAAARNLGISNARGSLVAFTDDDCLPAPDWLAALAAELAGDAACAGIGGPIRRARETSISRYIDHAGLMSHWVEDGIVEYLITANALYRTARVREVGGFATDFSLAGGEDADLSYRLRRAGYTLRMSDHGVVRHHHHDTARGFYRMGWRHGFGAALLAARDLAPRQKTGALPLAKSLVQALASRPVSGAQGIIEAVFWRGLGLVHSFAKQAGHRAGVRGRRRK